MHVYLAISMQIWCYSLIDKVICQILTHLFPILIFMPFENIKKDQGILMFSGYIEMLHFEETD